VASHASVSDKIRALDQAGFRKSEIADLLGKRYQHVRNVLVNDARRAGQRSPAAARAQSSSRTAGLAEAGAPYDSAADTEALIWLDVAPDGRLELPSLLRTALDVGRGGRILAEVARGGTVSLVSARTAVEQAQTIFQRYARPGISVVDELIAERRAETAREDQDD
jgi:hypothetical protein